MTKKRDIKKDQAITIEVMALVPFDRQRNRNWLGHTKGAAMLDAMLLVGATLEQMETAARRAVDEQIYHLDVEHGLKVVCVNGKYRFRNPPAAR